MRFYASLLIAAALLYPIRAQCPYGVRDRKEIRTLSEGEWTAFVTAVKTAMSGPTPTPYDRLVKIHIDNQNNIHNVANFFVWHRYYLREFEKELQKSNPNVMLPYWNWAYDSQAPEKSVVFRPNRFGGNGQNGNCVQDGAFGGWRPFYPQPHCLQRKFDAGTRINSLYSSDVITRMLSTSQSYDALRRSIEFAPHGSVHVGIGGDMSLMQSPNDPIFWLHHGYIDKIYARWQELQPAFAQGYGGPNADGSRATPNDGLPSFNARVHDVFDTKILCYKYSELPAAGTTQAPPTTTTTQQQQQQQQQPAKVPGPVATSAPRPAPVQVQQQAPRPPQQPPQQQQQQQQQSSRPTQQSQQSQSAKAHHHLHELGDILKKTFDDRLVRRTSDSSSDDEGRGHGHGRGHGRGGGRAQGQPPQQTQPPQQPRQTQPAQQTQPAPPQGSKDNVNIGVPGYDRSNLVALRTPRQLPPEWLAMNNRISELEVRDHESRYAKITDEINKLDAYIPPCSLWMREDLLDSLKGEVDKFYGTIHGRYVETSSISHQTPIDVIKDSVRKQCGGSVRGEVDEYKDALISIIGTALAPVNAASYPFTKPFSKEKIRIHF